ncbi:MAG: LysR family transcriptional regulator [Myxococcota bacterium]
MKLRDLELLARVSETGSMTVAARQLHLTPAAVSAAVHRIEEALGVRIFERTTRSLQTTDDGVSIIEAAEAAIERWEEGLASVRDPTANIAGRVHLSAPADTTYDVVAPVVANVIKAHPRLEVVVHAGDAVAHLHREALDLAIRYGPLRDSQLAARKLAETITVLVAAPEYLARRGWPERPSDLATHHCLALQLSGVPERTWTLNRRKTATEVDLGRTLCGDGHLTRRWALAGVGIARKSLLDVVDDLETGRLLRVLPEHDAGLGPVHVVFPSRRHMPPRVREVDRALAAAFAARAARCAAWLAS